MIPGTPAEVAGLRQNDIIISVDGEPVRNQTSFRALAHAKSPGAQLVLGLWRGAGQVEIAVILNKWDDVLNEVQDAADSPLHQAVEFRDLGLVALRLDAERLARLGFDSSIRSALYIQAIRLDGVGNDLGFRAGTVIIAANGRPISTPEDLVALLEDDGVAESGATLELVDIHNEHHNIKLLIPRASKTAPEGGGGDG